MSSRKRRQSTDSPPSFSELINKLTDLAASFIQGFDNSEEKMRQIVAELQKIADKVRKMQEETDEVRTAGAVTGGTALGLGLGLGILAAPFTGGASLLIGAVAGGAVGGGGAAVVVGTNVIKLLTEKGSAKKVEELGKEFMELVEPLKINLEEIKRMCEELEQRSAEGQAKRSLSDMEKLQKILRRVSELRERSGEALLLVLAALGMIGDMLLLILRVFRVTASPEEDQKLRDSIIQSADQCQKVTDAFDRMKEELRAFTES